MYLCVYVYADTCRTCTSSRIMDNIQGEWKRMLINGWTVVRRLRLSSMNEIGHGRMDAGETNSSHKKRKTNRITEKIWKKTRVERLGNAIRRLKSRSLKFVIFLTYSPSRNRSVHYGYHRSSVIWRAENGNITDVYSWRVRCKFFYRFRPASFIFGHPRLSRDISTIDLRYKREIQRYDREKFLSKGFLFNSSFFLDRIFEIRR